MKLRSTVNKLLTLLGVVALMTTVAAPAHAQSDDGDRAEAIASFVENGVTYDTAVELVDKFFSGELLDSMKPDSVPVDIVESYANGVKQTRSTYEDGSILITSLAMPSFSGESFGPQTIGDCASVTGGSGWIHYQDCAASATTEILEIQFRASWYLLSGAYDQLISIGSPYAYAIGGNAATPTLVMAKQYENSSGPARATATTQYNSAATTFTAILTLNVGSDSAWTTHNW